ncbi:hypothetical protein JXM83_02195 [Candidatus Woesearchaeota archaeon]|nr:hypothetical protein [Candidatus Woesearchaeota archaeon]
MSNSRKITKIKKLNITSVKDFIRIILKSPDISYKEIEDLIVDNRIKINKIDDNLFQIEAKNVPYSEITDFDYLISDLIEKIKEKHIEYYNSEEAKKSISFKDEIITQISSFIAKANESGMGDYETVSLLLQNILSDIYDHPDLDNSFLDRKTIEYLSRASVSKIAKDAGINLNEALKRILVNIQKLLYLWIFDKCNITVINYETDKAEVSEIDNLDRVEIENNIFDKISIPQRSRPRIDILYDSANNSVITSNFGKDKLKQILPFIYITIFDQVLFHIQIELQEIEKRALLNIQRSILQELQKTSEIESLDETQIQETRDVLVKSLDNFRGLLNNQINGLESQNRKIRVYYMRDYTRTLARQLNTRGISGSITNLTPLISLKELDKSVSDLSKISYNLAELSAQIYQKFSELTEAKRNKNPSLVKKISKEIRSFCVDVLAKSVSESLK